MVKSLSEVIQEKESIKQKMEQVANKEIAEFRAKVRELSIFCEDSCLFQDFGPQVEMFSKEFIQSGVIPILNSERTKTELQRQLTIFKKLKEKALCEQEDEEEYV